MTNTCPLFPPSLGVFRQRQMYWKELVKKLEPILPDMLISGVTSGSTYAMMAVSMSLVYRSI